MSGRLLYNVQTDSRSDNQEEKALGAFLKEVLCLLKRTISDRVALWMSGHSAEDWNGKMTGAEAERQRDWKA